MSFVASILLINLFGLFSHYFYRKYGILKGRIGMIFYYSIFIIGFFLIVDILLYVGIFNFIFPYLNVIPWVSIINGKDFMWNSFQLLGIHWNIDFTQKGLDYIAFLLFSSYPIWFKFFKDVSRKLFGGNRRKPYEKGISFLFSHSKYSNEDRRAIRTPRKV